MAVETKKARNPDRKGGKAWKKSHGQPVVKKVKSAEKVARQDKKMMSDGKGCPITLPSTDWNWLQNMMSDRWPSTHKLRTLDAWIEYHRKSPRKDDGIPLVIETNPEAKGRPNNKKGR